MQSSSPHAQPVHPRAELRRDPTVRELLRHSLHVAVDERASQATSQSRPIAARKHALRCLVDQQVKESVVRRGNGPAKACLRRAPGFLEGKLSGLPQQVCVQAHGGLDGFGSGAKSHVDPRPVIGLVPDVVAHDFSQLRTRLEIDALVLQHDPHPHCGVVRRIRTRFNLPRTYLGGKLSELGKCGLDDFCGSSQPHRAPHRGQQETRQGCGADRSAGAGGGEADSRAPRIVWQSGGSSVEPGLGMRSNWPFRKNAKTPASTQLPHGSWCSPTCLPAGRRPWSP